MDNEQAWGFFPDFDREGASGDETAIDACLRGATFRIDAEHNGKLEITYKNAQATVSSKGLWRRPTPPFSWGESVYIISKNIPAEVDDICWHFNNKRYFFYLTHNGKPMKKRYYTEDLEVRI